MKILIAPDKFKTSLSSRQVGDALTRGVKKGFPSAIVETLLVSDGAQGFLETLMQVESLSLIPIKVRGPLGKKVPAFIAYDQRQRRVYLESCQAAGFHLVPPEKRHPFQTSSAGLGDLLEAALRLDPEDILVGLGGTATCDAGIPAARHFGFEFTDEQKKSFQPSAETLGKIHDIQPPSRRRWEKVRIFAVADVVNPPVGPDGGVRIYSPQKGASPGDVEILENGMEHLLSLLETKLKKPFRKLKGGGAAGGLGLGLYAFFGAGILEGSVFVFEKLHLKDRIEAADAVITGEGRFDEQSLFGKIPGRIAEASLSAGKKTILVTGGTGIPQEIGSRLSGAFSIEELLESSGVHGTADSLAALEHIGELAGEKLGKKKN